MLDIQDFFEQRQGELVVRVGGRTRAFIFQARKAILLKGIEDVGDMLA